MSGSVKELIEKYKNHIKNGGLSDELYKWKLVGKYLGRPDINNKDFYGEIADIDFSNLIYHLSYAVMKELAQKRLEKYRNCYKVLFDESISLNDRIQYFDEHVSNIYKEVEQKNVSHHHDERTIATILTFHNPQKYTFYKDSFYRAYCKYLGIKSEKRGNKYSHYLMLIKELIQDYISKDSELHALINEHLDPNMYQDEKHMLLAQDILFQMLDKKKEINYWIFQGNPKYFDFETAIKNELLNNWTVSAHKDRMNKGDKVIIWLSGKNAGCYALAEIINLPRIIKSSSDDHLWKIKNDNQLKAGIKITHNFIDQPIYKTEIIGNKNLAQINVGNQGTNFTATKNEYETLKNMRIKMDDKKYWLYAPGENAYKWEEFYQKGIMAIGWDELGDLKQFKSAKEIEEKLLEIHSSKKRTYNDALANYEFANEISVGDIVIVKKGRTLLLGYGIIESDYYYDNEEIEYKHKRKVNWLKKGEWETGHSLVLKTLTNITNYKTDHSNFEKYYKRLLATIKEENNMNKESYYSELKKFLLQAQTSDLKTSDYKKKYNELSVKVSFGQGNISKVPWIAFLNNIDHVQKGIYPVYLFYKDKNILILAYGISETNIPNRSWSLKNKKTIKQYFLENNLGRPERYGSSFVYQTYDVSKEIKEDIINNDLNMLLDFYKSGNIAATKTITVKNISHHDFCEDTKNSGLLFNNDILLRFVASLITKPFLILTGLSGSGKTRLAQAFAMWICENKEQYCIVPVGADWTNREPLLGFPNALKEEEYVKPDNQVLDLIIAANNHPERPYILILDEMNLSHVERYFADFLSVMESGNQILLHSGDRNWNNIPPRLGFPDNLFVLGTVNIDETTYMFSPKVLDRANVIEFRVTKEEMEVYLDNAVPLNLEMLFGAGAGMAGDFLAIARDKNIKTQYHDSIHETMMLFFKELKKTGAEFGYRTASEILRFAAVVNKIEPERNENDILDAAIMQKLLPKVHGSRKKLEPVLKTLGTLCLGKDQNFDDYLKDNPEISYSDSSKIRYPLSLEKIIRMYKNLLSNGFTSFAEA